MDNNIKISIIIPVYQVENHLEKAVDSAIAQTIKEKEIILVDDGSQDMSGNICDRYEKIYPDLIKVIHKENEGLGFARNTGIQLSRGEYIIFLDSDDTIEPEMCEEMYDKALQGNYDIVMCDVRINYVDENRSTIVKSYSREEIDVSDYIANGNNITYSVNKLFRRSIWNDNRYEKMLFEDISLIPSMITNYPNIGYVQKPFYNYFRRSNTISTTFIGNMVDIIKAFKNFIDNSNQNYKEEVIYCVAKQLYWNMTQSRVIFQADFIDLLKEYKRFFLLNSYIQKDKKIIKILDFIDKEIIPNNIICVNFNNNLPDHYVENIKNNFPNAKLILVNESYYKKSDLPENVLQAFKKDKIDYAMEYYTLRTLFEEGGIVINSNMQSSLNLKKLRLDNIFFGFETIEDILPDCFGAVKNHYIIQLLLDSYYMENIFNKAFLPLKERIRDFLIINFGMKVNGRTQTLKNQIRVYMPNILSYDMKDGNNCCKRFFRDVPEGYELINESILKLWSDRIVGNWNMYKKERNSKHKYVNSDTNVNNDYKTKEEIKQVIDTYENSTCWKITKPIRIIGNLFGK